MVVEVVANQMQILDRAPQNGNDAKAAESSKPASPSMRAIIHLTSTETRSEIKCHFDWLPGGRAVGRAGD